MVLSQRMLFIVIWQKCAKQLRKRICRWNTDELLSLFINTLYVHWGLETVYRQWEWVIDVTVWLHSGSGSTCLISGIVMLVVLLFFVFGGFMYVELCRGILYDQDNGNIFKVPVISLAMTHMTVRLSSFITMLLVFITMLLVAVLHSLTTNLNSLTWLPV